MLVSGAFKWAKFVGMKSSVPVLLTLTVSLSMMLSVSCFPNIGKQFNPPASQYPQPTDCSGIELPTPRGWVNGEYIISCDDGDFDANTPEVAIAPPGTPWAGSMHAVWSELNNSVNEPFLEIHYSKSEAMDAGRAWSNDGVSEGDRLISQDFLPSSSNPGNPGNASKPAIAIDMMGWIHVVWVEQYPDSTYEIHYSRSQDNGQTWTAHDQRETYGDILVSSRNGYNAAWIDRVKIAVTDSPLTIHVVWNEVSPVGESTEIWYARSTNQGNIWTQPVQISMPNPPTAPGAHSPDIAVSGPGNSIVHVVWTQDIEIMPGLWASDVYYTRSPSNGMSWEPERHISQLLPETYASEAQIDALGSNLHVIWQQWSMTGNREVYYSGSQNDGITWSGDFEDIIISFPDGHEASDPVISSCIGLQGPEVHAVWVEKDETSPYGTDEILYSMSNNPLEPLSWTGSEHDNVVSRPDTDDSMSPAMAAGTVGGEVKAQVFWQEDVELNDKADKNTEIHYLPDMTFDIPVHLGWNLISVPLIQNDTDILTVLDDSHGDGNTTWNVVKWYNQLTTSDHWKTYRMNGTNNDLSNIDNTVGIWIDITAVGDGYLTVYGDYSTSTQIILKAGWNMVGYPAQTSVNITTALGGINDVPVEGYSSSSSYLITQLPGSYMMKPGEGYWVHVSADIVWTVDW